MHVCVCVSESVREREVPVGIEREGDSYMYTYMKRETERKKRRMTERGTVKEVGIGGSPSRGAVGTRDGPAVLLMRRTPTSTRISKKTWTGMETPPLLA